MTSQREWITPKKAFCFLTLILIAGFLLRLVPILNYDMGPNTFSDDNGYLTGGITFANHGYVSYDDTAAQTTATGPGMPFLLGALFSLFGYDASGLIAVHIAFASIGLITAIGAYLLGTLLRGRLTGLFAAAFCALEPGLVSVNSLFLTETPYMCLNLFVMYCFIRCAKEWNIRIYWTGILCMLVGAMFKGLILMAPLAALPLILRKKETLKAWLPRIAVVVLAFVIGFCPWWVRNYEVLNRFVPFTANRGDLQLLGSYMGWGYPEGTYDETILELDAEAWMNGTQDDVELRFARRGEVGKERLAEWFRTHPLGFVLTHLIYKPFKLTTAHLMQEPFVSERYSQYLWWGALIIALWGLICPKFGKKAEPGYYLPALYLLVATLITAVYAPLPRYGISHFPLWLFYTASGTADLCRRISRKG